MVLVCDPDEYSAKCIADVASKAGFSGESLSTAVAVALAESSGRTKAVSPTGCCHGLWQINTEVHPYTKAEMQVPAQNAAAAWKISKGGTNWKPWSAYNNGSYLLHTISANSAVDAHAQSPGDVIEDELSDMSNPLTGVMEPIVAVKDWISDRNNIFRIVKVAVGTIIIVVGLRMIIKQPVKTIIKEVKQ